MKAFLMFTALLLGIGGSVFAQASKEKDPAKRAQHYTDKLETELGLTAEQKPKVYEINLDAAKKMIAIEDKFAVQADKAGMGKEKKAVEDERETKLTAVLTPDQMTKYREFRKAKMQQHRKGK